MQAKVGLSFFSTKTGIIPLEGPDKRTYSLCRLRSTIFGEPARENQMTGEELHFSIVSNAGM